MSKYVLASVVWFGGETIMMRCRETERRSGCVWVVTADLRDAGTPLVLDEDKVRPEPGTETSVLVHKDGLVGFGR